MLTGFEQWVAAKCQVPTVRTWDRIILCFSQDEANALDTFFIWFDE